MRGKGNKHIEGKKRGKRAKLREGCFYRLNVVRIASLLDELTAQARRNGLRNREGYGNNNKVFVFSHRVGEN